jgi:very-short-patch-repair endonuclease
MTSLIDLLGPDGVASIRSLEQMGMPRAMIARSVESGGLLRIRHGWVASPGAADDAVQAVRVGGSLTCLSVLRRRHIWCDDDHLLHVRVGRHSGHLSAPNDRSVELGRPAAHGIRLHRDDVDSRTGVAVDPMPVVLTHLFRCQPRENVIVSLDSALRGGHILLPELRAIVARLPAKYTPYLDLVDMSSESGLETKARLRLRGLGIPYRAQVRISGVGYVDLLIGERLVLELDGEAWHSGPIAYAEDRRRDLELMRQGFVVMRLSFSQVMNQWAAVEAVIRSMVARREHLWSARHRRDGLG